MNVTHTMTTAKYFSLQEPINKAVFNESMSQREEKCNNIHPMILVSMLIAEFDNFNPPLLSLVAHYSRLREKINVVGTYKY